MISEKKMLSLQIASAIILMMVGGFLLEFSHAIGWAFMAIGFLAGLEALVEEIRQEIIGTKKR